MSEVGGGKHYTQLSLTSPLPAAEPGSPAHDQLQGTEMPRAQHPVGLSDDSPLIISRICDWN